MDVFFYNFFIFFFSSSSQKIVVQKMYGEGYDEVGESRERPGGGWFHHGQLIQVRKAWLLAVARVSNISFRPAQLKSSVVIALKNLLPV